MSTTPFVTTDKLILKFKMVKNIVFAQQNLLLRVILFSYVFSFFILTQGYVLLLT